MQANIKMHMFRNILSLTLYKDFRLHDIQTLSSYLTEDTTTPITKAKQLTVRAEVTYT